MGKAATRSDHISKAAANFTKRLTGYCLHGCGCQWWSY